MKTIYYNWKRNPLIILSLSLSLSAQTFNNPYLELRHTFGNLNFGPAPYGSDFQFLHELSVHMADDIFYTPKSYDASNSANFF